MFGLGKRAQEPDRPPEVPSSRARLDVIAEPKSPLVEAPVAEDLAILLKPGFVGTLTVRRPGGRPMVTATADVWPFVATGPLAKFLPPGGDT